MTPKFYTPYINNLQRRKTKLNLTPLIKLFFPLLSFYLKYKYYKRLKQMNIKYKRILLRRYSPDAYIFASIPYILTAIDSKSIDQSKIKQAKKLLKKVYPVKSQNWEDLSLEYANVYIAFFMQKLG